MQLAFQKQTPLGGITVIRDGNHTVASFTPDSRILSNTEELLKFCEEFPKFYRQCHLACTTHDLLPQ